MKFDEDDLVESGDTAVQPVADDMEDTFRSGPPGGVRYAEPEHDDTADTGEMLAAVETDDVLDDAGPTAKTPKPEIDPPRRVRVVERTRDPKLETPPAKVERPKLRMPSLRPAPKAVMPKAETLKDAAPKYDPFKVEDPPAVGVDPAVFPIHRTAPDHRLGQRIVFGLVGVMMTLIVIAFVVGGESSEARAVRLARESYAARAAERQHAAAEHRIGSGGERSRNSRGPIDRASRIRRPRKGSTRAERVRLIRRPDRKPFEFAPGKVDQPRKYGAHAEHVAPPGTKPLLIVMSTPQALVYRDEKLIGATPMLVPVDEKTESMALTLKTFGYKEKKVDVRPAASGNLEASVTLEKDPAFVGRKVVNVEKPKDKS